MIIGLTDRGAAFPRIGILRKGAPKRTIEKNGKQIEVVGTDLQDHFRFDTDDKEAATAFIAAYGEKPNNIRVTFFYRSAAENFEAWQEHHSAGALKHRCDGQTCILHLGDDGAYHHNPIPCPSIAKKANDPKINKMHLCRPVGRLKIIVPELNRMAYVLVATTSINDILELQGNLEAAEAMHGDLRGIEFVLSRRMRKVSTPSEGGQRRRVDKWLLSLEPSPAWVRLQLAAMQQAARLASVGTPALALPAAGETGGASYTDPETGDVFDGDEEPEESLIEKFVAEDYARDNPHDPAVTSDTAAKPAPEPATVRGAASRFHSWYADDGAPRIRLIIGETHIIGAGQLAETWFDIADEDSLTVAGAWATHPKIGRYIAAATIERAPVAMTEADLPF
jgi:hypothetical protein